MKGKTERERDADLISRSECMCDESTAILIPCHTTLGSIESDESSGPLTTWHISHVKNFNVEFNVEDEMMICISPEGRGNIKPFCLGG